MNDNDGAAAALTTGSVPSPCTGVCTMDQASGLCAGCARTLDEIAGWGAYSDARKRAVLAALPSRRAGHAGWHDDGRR